MTISVLVCKTDGTQVLEEREVSDQYLQMEPPPQTRRMKTRFLPQIKQAPAPKGAGALFIDRKSNPKDSITGRRRCWCTHRRRSSHRRW